MLGNVDIPRVMHAGQCRQYLGDVDDLVQQDQEPLDGVVQLSEPPLGDGDPCGG